ncbi:hypothetical protein D7X33_22345 [Butyricicoccus sp. 1XD8-22]|nr:hypothetical protein D7X33_22345 [Butyricicoccus sp. 1XD8-22]
MKYKYEDRENVVAKQDFEVFRHDENGKLVGVVTIPKGCKGIVKSMGCSSTDNFRNSYDILFVEGETEINVAVYEENEELFKGYVSDITPEQLQMNHIEK